MNGQYSDLYRQYCEAMAAAAAEKLGRALSEQEAWGIWNQGSVMMLEVVERTLTSAQSAQEVEKALNTTIRAAQGRVTQSMTAFREKASDLLGRALSEDEVQRVESLQKQAMFTVTAMQLLEQLSDAPPENERHCSANTSQNSA